MRTVAQTAVRWSPNQRWRFDPAPPPQRAKRYEAPALRRITLEQAKLICIPQAWDGHQGARELLELLFSEEALAENKKMPEST